jgi:hypothetical protein
MNITTTTTTFVATDAAASNEARAKAICHGKARVDRRPGHPPAF